MATYTLVLIRHGESEWNQKNLFCGWHDANLSETGLAEAKLAGQLLREQNYTFDVAFTSVLKRAIKTLFLVQDELDLHWIPVQRHWRLNERHYGALQGLDKAETAKKYGDDQVHIWRRSYDIPPPALTPDDERWSGRDRRYSHLDSSCVPACECLQDTVARVLPYWYDNIVPAIKSGKRVLISAHGNSLRALVKYLDKMTNEDVLALNIPTGIPLVYKLDADLKPIEHFYLGDQEKLKAAMEKVANQGKAKQ